MSAPDHIQVIWNALHGYRETCLPEGGEAYDAQWDDICTAMAHIEEDLVALDQIGTLSAMTMDDGGLTPEIVAAIRGKCGGAS